MKNKTFRYRIEYKVVLTGEVEAKNETAALTEAHDQESCTNLWTKAELEDESIKEV